MAPRAGNDIGPSGRIVLYKSTPAVESEQRIVPLDAECDGGLTSSAKLLPISKACPDDGIGYGNDETEAVDRLRFAELPALASQPSRESVPEANPKHKTVRRPTSFMTDSTG